MNERHTQRREENVVYISVDWALLTFEKTCVSPTHTPDNPVRCLTNELSLKCTHSHLLTMIHRSPISTF